MTRIIILHIEDAFGPPEEDPDPEGITLEGVWEDGEQVWGEPFNFDHYEEEEAEERILQTMDGPYMFAFREENCPIDVPPTEELEPWTPEWEEEE